MKYTRTYVCYSLLVLASVAGVGVCLWSGATNQLLHLVVVALPFIGCLIGLVTTMALPSGTQGQPKAPVRVVGHSPRPQWTLGVPPSYKPPPAPPRPERRERRSGTPALNNQHARRASDWDFPGVGSNE